jgi:hypothetical protein
MMEKCYDSGTIQAFLDGELSPALTQKVTGHIALCDACASSLAEAEDETTLVFSALEREYDTLVPTHRLWAKINDSIAVQKKQSSVWQRFLAFVSIQISSPSFAVAAGVLIIFAIFAGVLSLQNPTNISELAKGEERPVSNSVLQTDSTESSDKILSSNPPDFLTVSTPNEKESKSPKVYPAVKRENDGQRNVKNLVANANYTSSDQPKTKDQKPKTETAEYLPGEESYVKTIANLTQTVEGQKDAVLRPSAQVSFERDLAVVNDAIGKMKKEVRKNPRNESAKQVLYSSYQNKIDLLNSVAEKNELMASLK